MIFLSFPLYLDMNDLNYSKEYNHSLLLFYFIIKHVTVIIFDFINEYGECVQK